MVIPITAYPLIAVTEVLDMPSTDCRGVAGDIMERKLQECLDYKDWTRNTVFRCPIAISNDGYGPVVSNGHHRAAWEIYMQGALFLHYADNYSDSTDEY